MAKGSSIVGGDRNQGKASTGGAPRAPGGTAKSGGGSGGSSAGTAGGKGTLGPMGGTASGGSRGQPTEAKKGYNNTDDGGSGMPN